MRCAIVEEASCWSCTSSGSDHSLGSVHSPEGGVCFRVHEQAVEKDSSDSLQPDFCWCPCCHIRFGDVPDLVPPTIDKAQQCANKQMTQLLQLGVCGVIRQHNMYSVCLLLSEADDDIKLELVSRHFEVWQSLMRAKGHAYQCLLW